MREIILVRHGETVWNQEQRYQGQQDIPLSPRGEAQAARLRERFRHYPLETVYSSDLGRAQQTAAIIAEPHNLPVTAAPELREANFGAWEGLKFSEARDIDRDFFDQWLADPASVAFPRGESYGEVKERSYQFIQSLAGQSDGSVLAASHGGTIRAVVSAVLDLPLDRIWRLSMDNASVTIIRFYDGRPVLKVFNDTCHLDDLA